MVTVNMQDGFDRLFENMSSVAGCIIGLPSWSDVDVLADGERVVENGRTDHQGHLYLSEDFWERHGGTQIDVYVRQTYEERSD